MIGEASQRATVLACWLPQWSVADALLDVWRADGGEDALKLVRDRRFDLLVAGPSVPDMPLPAFIRRLRGCRPSQAWALAGPNISEADELCGRCNGAVAVLDAPPTAAEALKLARALGARRRWDAQHPPALLIARQSPQLPGRAPVLFRTANHHPNRERNYRRLK
jgi:DNA-binding response OmpR family regulator